MAAVIEHTLTTQLRDAVVLVRSSRHHPSCRCHSWRGERNAPYCTPREETASKILNTLIRRAAW